MNRYLNDTAGQFEDENFDEFPFVNYTEMRVNDYYVNYYINWSRNIVTGVLPIVSLIIFNQLVYKKLVKRRNLWKQGRSIIEFYYSFGLLERVPIHDLLLDQEYILKS